MTVVDEALETVLIIETTGFRPSFHTANAFEPPPKDGSQYVNGQGSKQKKYGERHTCILGVAGAAGIAAAIVYLLTGRRNRVTAPAVGTVRQAEDWLILPDAPRLAPSHSLERVGSLIGQHVTDGEATLVYRSIQGEAGTRIILRL